jgi:DNA-binding protein H-NS
MSIDLNNMNLKDLKDLHARVGRAISGFEDRKRKEALAELEEVARAKGFSLAELTGTVTLRKRSPAVAKYANPSNASETWSGRGRKPRWFVAALKAGRNPSDMSI